MSIHDMSRVLSDLSISFGDIKTYKILDTDWTRGIRQNPLLFTTLEGKFVYHPLEEIDNIKHYKQKLDKKNNHKVITSPIRAILKRGFVTSFVEGDVLTKSYVKNIPAIAHLQAALHKVEDYNLDLWYEKINLVHSYLLQCGLVMPKGISRIQFSMYGFLHGDYSSNNIIQTPKGLVAIDLEHILEGPIAFDLARPLLRVCSDKTEQEVYLNNYFQGKSPLSPEELRFGRIMFFLIQAYDRHRFGYPKEAKVSLERFKELFK